MTSLDTDHLVAERRRDRQARDNAHGIERGDDRGGGEKPDVNREGRALEDEEVQVGGNARHAFEDAIES